MPWRIANSELEPLVAFASRHPAGLDGSLVRRIVMHLVRGPDAVLVMTESTEDPTVRALAAVVDTCTNADDNADLELLGQSGTLSPGQLDALFQLAERVAGAGPRSAIDVAVTADRGSWGSVLEQRGYDTAYTLFDMSRRVDLPLVDDVAPLPEGWAWRELEWPYFSEYHRAVAASFVSVTGARVPPLEETVRALHAAIHPPHILLAHNRLAAFSQVELHADGTGELRSLGRAIEFRGRGLGDHIVRHSVEHLVERGARRLRLEVATRNTAALILYRRHGFELGHQARVFRRATP